MSFPWAWGGLVLCVSFFINSFLYPWQLPSFCSSCTLSARMSMSVLEQVWDAGSQSGCADVRFYSCLCSDIPLTGPHSCLTTRTLNLTPVNPVNNSIRHFPLAASGLKLHPSQVNIWAHLRVSPPPPSAPGSSPSPGAATRRRMWEPSDPFPSPEPTPAVCLGRWASGSHPERCMPVAGRGLWGGVPIQFLETSLMSHGGIVFSSPSQPVLGTLQSLWSAPLSFLWEGALPAHQWVILGEAWLVLQLLQRPPWVPRNPRNPVLPTLMWWAQVGAACPSCPSSNVPEGLPLGYLQGKGVLLLNHFSTPPPTHSVLCCPLSHGTICWGEGGTQEGQQSSPITSVIFSYCRGPSSLQNILIWMCFPSSWHLSSRNGVLKGGGERWVWSGPLSFLAHGEKSSGHLVAQDRPWCAKQELKAWRRGTCLPLPTSEASRSLGDPWSVAASLWSLPTCHMASALCTSAFS